MRVRHKELFVSVGLAAITLGLFWHVLGNDFVNYDDDKYIINNPNVKSGLSVPGFWWALSDTTSANWYPLTWLSFQFDRELTPKNAYGFHLTSLVLHILNTILLFRILSWWTGALWPSACAAALFAWHPLHVEAFAWASARKDVLSTFFWMLALLCYGFHARKPRIWKYLLVVLFFGIGLTAKPMLVTFPFVLLLLDYWPLGRMQAAAFISESSWAPPFMYTSERGRSFGYLLMEKIPLLLMSAASAGVTMVAQLAQPNGVPANTWQSLPLRIEHALVGYVTYLGKVFWPHTLSPLIPFPRQHYPWDEIVGAAVTLLVITYLAIRWRRQAPYFLVGWLWYLGTLFPVTGILEIVGGQGMADRYTYIPLIGIFIALVWGVHDVLAAAGERRLLAPVAVGSLAFFMGQSYRQVTHWHDSEALWKHVIAVTRDNAIAHNNLGHTMSKQGRAGEAVKHFKVATEIEQTYLVAQENLAVDLERLGRLDESLACYKKAQALDPSNMNYYMQAARLELALKKWDDAVAEYRKAISINPREAEMYGMLGRAYQQKGNWPEAVKYYRQALAIQDMPKYHSALGYALHQVGQPALGDEEYRKASRGDPKWLEEAVYASQRLSLHIDPARRNPPEAIAIAQMACQATGNKKPGPLEVLAAAYAQNGEFEKAIATAKQALALCDDDPGMAAVIKNRMVAYERRQPLRE